MSGEGEEGEVPSTSKPFMRWGTPASPWMPKKGELFLHIRHGGAPMSLAEVMVGEPETGVGWRWFDDNEYVEYKWHACDDYSKPYGYDAVTAEGRSEGAHCMGLLALVVPVPEEWEAVFRLGGCGAFEALMKQGEEP